MAIMDAQLEFSTDQAVTAAAASENIIDLSDARNIGVGKKLHIVIVVKETMDDTGDNSELVVTLETDDNAAFSSAATVQTLVTIPATTAAGTQYVVELPDEVLAAYQRYARLYYTPADGDLSAGKFDAFITDNVTQHKHYASGYDIA